VKIIEVVQGTGDWFAVRAGIPTASEFSNLITPTGKIRTGETVETYLAKKLAERWTGGPLPTTYGGGALEQGALRQNEGVRWYAYDRSVSIREVGFVLSDDGRIGCSPDGMFDDGTGIETKCPALHTQVGYLLDGIVPAEYTAQVQGSMLVTGAPRWVFLSYCRNFPPLVLTVTRDEKFIGALREALDAFLGRLDDGFARLTELNGGPPARTPPPAYDDDGILPL